MTDLHAAVEALGLNRFVPGLAQTELRNLVDDHRGIPDRSVIWIEFEDGGDPARLDEATDSSWSPGLLRRSTSDSLWSW